MPPFPATWRRLCSCSAPKSTLPAPQGQRRIPLSDLYVEDGKAHLTLADGELIVAVHLPAKPPPSAYEKVRMRGAIDFPLAGVAVALAVKGKTIGSLRIALTGTNSRPFLLDGTDAFVGQALDDKLLQEIDRRCRSRCSRCAPRLHPPIIGASPPPRWPGG